MGATGFGQVATAALRRLVMEAARPVGGGGGGVLALLTRRQGIFQRQPAMQPHTLGQNRRRWWRGRLPGWHRAVKT